MGATLNYLVYVIIFFLFIFIPMGAYAADIIIDKSMGYSNLVADPGSIGISAYSSKTDVTVTGNVKANPGSITMAANTGTITLDVGGNITAGSFIEVFTDSGTATLNVDGNVAAGNFIEVFTDSGTATLNVDGNVAAGSFIEVYANTGTATLDVSGNVEAGTDIWLFSLSGSTTTFTADMLDVRTDTTVAVLGLNANMHADTIALIGDSTLRVTGNGYFGFDTFKVLGAGAKYEGNLKAADKTITFNLNEVSFQDSKTNLKGSKGMLDVQAGTKGRSGRGDVDISYSTITFDGLVPDLNVGDQIALLSYSGRLTGFVYGENITYNKYIFELTNASRTLIATVMEIEENLSNSGSFGGDRA